MYSREDFLKFIPKPTNEDVILYDISLTDLIDENVDLLYTREYPKFLEKKERYLNLKTEIDNFNSTVDNLYLFNKKWQEQDYLQALHNDKKTYSILYNDIKKRETNIDILKKKLSNLDEKIEIQKSKEKKDLSIKKEDVEKKIETNKEKLLNYKNYLKSYEESLKEIEINIKENEEDFQLMQETIQQFDLGVCKCSFCGNTLKSKDSVFYNRCLKKIEKNKKDLEKFLNIKNKLELNIVYYENEIAQIKENLNNFLNLKKDSRDIFSKKSLEVLKLEALKDEILKKIEEEQDFIDKDSKTHSKQYLELKDRIYKYELSINNLKKVKELKESNSNKIQTFNDLKEELIELSNKIKKYLKFLSIYYKIYEKKASEYCGNDFKFTFFRIDEYSIKEVFNIYYKDIEYSQLNEEDRKKVDEIIINKFTIYF